MLQKGFLEEKTYEVKNKLDLWNILEKYCLLFQNPIQKLEPVCTSWVAPTSLYLLGTTEFSSWVENSNTNEDSDS